MSCSYVDSQWVRQENRPCGLGFGVSKAFPESSHGNSTTFLAIGIEQLSIKPCRVPVGCKRRQLRSFWGGGHCHHKSGRLQVPFTLSAIKAPLMEWTRGQEYKRFETDKLQERTFSA